MKSTFKDEYQMEFSLFPITGMITGIFLELTLASKENPWFSQLQSQEKHAKVF